MKHKTLTLMAFLFTSFTALAGDFDFKVNVHGEGQPMLLIPGLSNAAEVWDSTVEQFKGQYEMHTVTLPGFAGQPPLKDTEDFLNQVRDQLLGYIKKQGWEKPIIVGHSLGGYVSMLMAIEQTELFEKIIRVDSVPFIPALTMPGATEESAKFMSGNMKAQMDGQTEEMNAANLDMILATMITDPENIKLAKQWGIDSDSATVSQAMYEMMTRDIRDEIAVIKSPTLVMGSWIAYQVFGMSRERLQQSYGAQYEAMPDQRLAVTDTGKHFIMWDDPEFYFATMADFLKQ